MWRYGCNHPKVFDAGRSGRPHHHLDMIWLPPDLFTSQAPRHLKDRMPFVAEGKNGKEWVANNGASFGGVGSAGRLYEPGKQHRADRMAEAGLYEDGLKGIRRP